MRESYDRYMMRKYRESLNNARHGMGDFRNDLESRVERLEGLVEKLMKEIENGSS